MQSSSEEKERRALESGAELGASSGRHSPLGNTNSDTFEQDFRLRHSTPVPLVPEPDSFCLPDSPRTPRFEPPAYLLPPPSPSAVPFEMSSDQSCVQYPSIRTATSSIHSTHRSVKYVYDLPYNVRKSICDLLDADNSWRELGGRYMGFNDTQLTLISHALYRSGSPTNDLLTKWESSNAKVSQLYKFLYAMKHRRAMFYLLGYVNDQLRMLYDGFDENEVETIHQSTYQTVTAITNPNSMKILNKHSKSVMPNHAQFFEHNLNNSHENLNKSDEEKTLVDLKKEKKPSNKDGKGKLGDDVDYFLRLDDFKIAFKELAIATDDFCKDNILGSGGFGTVYIGEWKGTKVAVKKLKGVDNLSQALTELRILNCCRIDNILPLYGVSLDGPEPCLVYQYMPNGSLEDRLLCKGQSMPLVWAQRAKIGEGIARALNFLHTLKGNPFVHGDVKSANILLDPMFEPKLGDFGLARQVVQPNRNENSIYTHCTVSSVNGTSVYLPAEYLRNKILSPAVDVYSYGIVVLEMATGRRAYDGKKLLINTVEDEYIRIMNQRVTGNQPPSHQSQTENLVASLMDRRIIRLNEDRFWFNYLLELGRKCAQRAKTKRPTMIQILEYFNQCRTNERIHQIREKILQNKRMSSKINLSKSNVRTPLELQLWYDFVRKSCGTLSDVVFEKFGAEVTKIMEDMNVSTKSSEDSKFYLDQLMNSNNLPETLAQFNQNQTCEHNSNNKSKPSVSPHDSSNLPELMDLMSVESSEYSMSTIADDDSQADLVEPELPITATPVIPLLTALGFEASDIEELMQTNL